MRVECRSVRPENAEIEFAVEERDAQTRGRQGVAMRAGLPLNEAAEPEASEVVGHLRGGIRATEEGGDAGSQIAVAKAGGEMSKAGECLTEGLDARITEPQRRDANAPEMKRALE